jgi:hypothetical protein
MHFRPLLAVSIAAALLVAVAATPASAASCGTSQALRAYTIKTRHLSCRSGKKVIREWNKRCSKHPRARCTLRRYHYRCRYSFDGYEAATIKCTRGARRVTWKTV